MKYVQENLFEYEDSKFFNSLNEAEEKEELSPAEKKAKKAELQKKGMAVVQKCLKNFDNFKKFAGDIWQEYRDFWTTQKDADESVQQEGMFYNLWKSDYIVGVVKEPNGSAALKVFNTSAGDDDEYVAFSSTNPEVINAFNDFLNGTVKFTMKDIIVRQKEAMTAKKKADEQRKKEENSAKKQAKLDAFLVESAKGRYIEFTMPRDVAGTSFNDEMEGTIIRENPDGSYDVQLEHPIRVMGHKTNRITVEKEDVLIIESQKQAKLDAFLGESKK